MRRESSSSVKIWRATPRDVVISVISDFAKHMLVYDQIHNIWLFGSYATGKFAYGSDVDVCIIISDDSSRWDYYSIMNELDKFPLDIEIQLHIYTSSEFSKMKEEGSHFISSILSEGIKFHE